MFEYTSIQQATSALSVSTKTIRRRIADGTIPAKRIGTRTMRIPAHSLNGVGYAMPASRRS
ncbi:excisionase family DNA-binding protein [Microbacterium stercoris]|uniref:Excisionase family DNA-binding protein n=1 Tax=Microbacterium stercoris TaxID=2820289 RepID=A0A939QJJ4_9MICO|nr:excisionase family DNA-binding protein [Microbacterium stercoris]MBO3664069.1 excisionase family DNA-binding protein [Microbacterium stercoris]